MPTYYTYLVVATTQPSPLTTPDSCMDHSDECPRLDQLIHICSNHEKAALTCQKYCNLCGSCEYKNMKVYKGGLQLQDTSGNSNSYMIAV
jgi:hypothetical protein